MTRRDDWSCVDAARRRTVPRVPCFLGGDAQPFGSVTPDDATALRRWPALFAVDRDAVRLHPLPDLEPRLDAVHAALRDEGRIRAWRDERFTLWQPATMRPVGAIERAAARFWGALTLGAHASGYVADGRGRPTHLWIAQRSLTKPTDPGKLDNLVGGGVPHGQTPFEALVREGWEEAGLDAATMAAARPGRVACLECDIDEGLQVEHLHAWDLPLAAGVVPRNQDGEVAALRLVPVDEAIALAAGDTMTVDAALVTLDFALRHGLLAADEHARLAEHAAPLWLSGREAGIDEPGR